MGAGGGVGGIFCQCDRSVNCLPVHALQKAVREHKLCSKLHLNSRVQGTLSFFSSSFFPFFFSAVSVDWMRNAFTEEFSWRPDNILYRQTANETYINRDN